MSFFVGMCWILYIISNNEYKSMYLNIIFDIWFLKEDFKRIIVYFLKIF